MSLFDAVLNKRYRNVVNGEPCTGRGKLSPEGQAEVRQLAAAMQRAGRLGKNVDVQKEKYQRLCDAMHETRDPSKLRAALIGAATLAAAAAVGRAAAGHGSLVARPRGMPAIAKTPALLKQTNVATRARNVTKTPAFRSARARGNSASSGEARQHAAGVVREVMRTNPFAVAQADPCGIAPGTHIMTDMGLGMSHHGVYLGNCYTVEVTGEDTIQLKTMDSFIGDGPVWTRMYDHQLPYAKIAARAVAAIGPHSYCMFLENCEHFATQMVTGARDSRQVRAAIAASILIAGAVAGVVVANETTRARKVKRVWRAMRRG